MSDTEYLDLDEAVPSVKKTVKLNGEEYPFKEPSIEDFSKEITRMKKIKKSIAEMGDKPADELEEAEAEMMLNVMLDGIRQAFPTMPEDVLNGLSMARITAIREFIQSEITEQAEDESGNA